MENIGCQMNKIYSVVKVMCSVHSDATLFVGIMTNTVHFIVPKCQSHLDAECEKIL